MKHILRIIASLSVIVCLASCQQFKIDTQMTQKEFEASVKLVSDVLDSYTLAAKDPQTITFSVSANVPWTITGNTEWLSVTPFSSSVSSLVADVVVTAAPNTTLEDRTATLILKSDTYQTRTYTVKITQQKFGQLYVQPIFNNFVPEGGSLPFSIETNNAWTVRSSQGWLTFDKEQGEPDQDCHKITVRATAQANLGAARTAVVTVTAGDDEEVFEVVQNGVKFEIVRPASTTLPAGVSETILAVDAKIAWTVSAEGDGFTAVKADDSHIKVTTTVNNKFAPRKGTVTIKSDSGDTDSVELSQDINFILENCEILQDGSAKFSAAKGSKIYLKDNYRALKIVLTMGEKHFGDNANLWVHGEMDSAFGNVNVYNWLDLGVKARVRSEGTMIATGETSYYGSTDYTISKSQLDAMNVYEYDIHTDSSDPTKIDIIFSIDGTVIGSRQSGNFLAADPEAYLKYYFGYYSAREDGTTYVVKTCDITRQE